MDTIFGAEQPTLLGTPAVPTRRKKPGLAFLLSLLVPGAGHFYCGKTIAGIWTLGFFAAFVGVMRFVDPQQSMNLWGFCLRGAVVLYTYAFLDAYFSAREINAGTDSVMTGSNPRIAAVLNLLTNGFGYFYLGKRKQGLI